MRWRVAAGWRIAASAWSAPVANRAAERLAKDRHAPPASPSHDRGDAELVAAFAKLTTDGVDATAAARADLVAIGSGPGERTVGGAAFARPWNAAWKGHVAVVSSLGHLAPSKTTGWVVAHIELAKAGSKQPFLVFCVFDKAADGTWSLAHIHFAT